MPVGVGQGEKVPTSARSLLSRRGRTENRRDLPAGVLGRRAIIVPGILPGQKLERKRWMSYADQQQGLTGTKLVALIIALAIVGGIGAVMVVGLAINAIKKEIERVTTIDIEEPPPPEEPDEAAARAAAGGGTAAAGCSAAADQHRPGAAADSDAADDSAAVTAGLADPAACSGCAARAPASAVQGAWSAHQERTQLGIAHSGKLSCPRPARGNRGAPSVSASP